MLLKVLCFCFGIGLYAVQGDHGYDYHWESYNGTVPENAISVDSNGEKIYIGAVNTYKGRCVGVLKPNVVEIELNCYGYDKILCGDHKDKYSWKPANNETFVEILDYNRFVFIGQKYRYDTANVGGNLLWVGRNVRPDANPQIVMGNIEEPEGIFYYAANGKAYNMTGPYEALVYEPEIEETVDEAENNEANTGEETGECIKPPNQADADIETPSESAVTPEPPEEKPSDQKPACQDIIGEGVNAANSALNKGQIDSDCLGVKASASTPSEMVPEVTTPSLPSGGKINVG